jgi:hypothetical protein
MNKWKIIPAPGKRHAFLVVFLCFFPLLTIAESLHRVRVFVPVVSSGNVNAFDEMTVSGTIEQSVTVPFVGTLTSSLSVTGAVEEKITSQPKSSGFSLHYISPINVGVGYTAMNIEYEADLIATEDIVVSGTILGNSGSGTLVIAGDKLGTESVKLEFGFLDVFYTLFFDSGISATAGLGLPILKADVSIDVSLQGDTSSTFMSGANSLVQSAANSGSASSKSGHALFLSAGYQLESYEIIASVRQSQFSATYDISGSALGSILDVDEIKKDLTVMEIAVGFGYHF